MDVFRNAKIQRDVGRGAFDHVPSDVDGIVVGCRLNDWRRSGSHVVMNVPVEKGSSRGMIEILGVDMGERRLIEAEQKG